jgi:hypothetical protein
LWPMEEATAAAYWGEPAAQRQQPRRTIGAHEPWRPVLKVLLTRGEVDRSAVDDPDRPSRGEGFAGLCDRPRHLLRLDEGFVHDGAAIQRFICGSIEW